jgi:hypothetical protein
MDRRYGSIEAIQVAVMTEFMHVKTDLLHGSLEEPLSTTILEPRPRYIIPSIYGDICHLEERSDETGLPKRYMSQEFCHLTNLQNEP